MNIPVVVAAYDRVQALQRLLASLVRAEYAGPVKLIISIDGKGAPEVHECAEHFSWPHGEKEVILHGENLGLRKHILFCGGLSKQYDGIILLEDDLYVSPWFYQYAVEAAAFYKNSSDVAGIALYASRFNESARLPFYPLDDGFDVYFMQVACSWGQLWLNKQWEDFEAWYTDNSDVELSGDRDLPFEIRQWPDSSWKKYFIKYLIESNTYFVYPRFSLSTNFGDMGQHHTGTSLHQVPLLLGRKKKIHFVAFSQSVVKYDAFCEIQPESLVRLCRHFDSAEFVVDLYGIKEKHCFTKQYVLTSKSCDQYIQSFGRFLIPIEYNIVDAVPGNDLFFATVEDVCNVDESDFRLYIYTKCATLEEQKYFYNISSLHYFLLNKEIKKFKSMYSMGQDKIKILNTAIDNLQSELGQTQKDLAGSRKSIQQIRKSISYRIGNKIIYPFSLIKKTVKKKE